MPVTLLHRTYANASANASTYAQVGNHPSCPSPQLLMQLSPPLLHPPCRRPSMRAVCHTASPRPQLTRWSPASRCQIPFAVHSTPTKRQTCIDGRAPSLFNAGVCEASPALPCASFTPLAVVPATSDGVVVVVAWNFPSRVVSAFLSSSSSTPYMTTSVTPTLLSTCVSLSS